MIPNQLSSSKMVGWLSGLGWVGKLSCLFLAAIAVGFYLEKNGSELLPAFWAGFPFGLKVLVAALLGIGVAKGGALTAWWSRLSGAKQTALTSALLFGGLVLSHLTGSDALPVLYSEVNVGQAAAKTANALKNPRQILAEGGEALEEASKVAVNEQKFLDHPFFKDLDPSIREDLGEHYIYTGAGVIVRSEPYEPAELSEAEAVCNQIPGGRLGTPAELEQLSGSPLVGLRYNQAEKGEWTAERYWFGPGADHKLYHHKHPETRFFMVTEKADSLSGEDLQTFVKARGYETGTLNDQQIQRTLYQAEKRKALEQLPVGTDLSGKFAWLDGGKKAAYRCILGQPEGM